MAIQTNKALFKVVGNTTSPSTARGYNAVAGEVLSFQLEDSTGVLNALWETYDPASSSSPLSTLNAPTFPFTGSGSPSFTSSAPPFSGAATVPTPSGGQPLSNSYFVRCTVATASGPQTFTRSINCTGGLGRKPVPGEVTENSLRGWADDWSALVDNTTPLLMVFTNQITRRAQALTVADLGRRGLQLDTAKIWDVVPSLAVPGTYVWGDNAGPESVFNPDMSTLLTGLTVRSFWQPHLSIVEDTTLVHTAGSGPVLGFTGTRSGAPTSCTITTTGSGALGAWTGLCTFGDGSTLAFTSAATVSLASTRYAGLTLTIGAGSAVAGTDIWKAAAATLTDTVTSNSLASNGASTSGIIMPGVNGRATVASDGTRYWHNNTADLPAPSFTLIAAFRKISDPGTDKFAFAGDTGFFGSIKSLATGGIDMYNGTLDANFNAGPVAGTWGLLIASYTGSASDSLKFGTATAITGQNAGASNPPLGRALGARIDGAFGCACEFGWGCWVDGGIPANIAAIVAANNTLYAGGIPG